MTRTDSPRGSFQSPVRAVLQAQCPGAPVKRRPHKYRPGTKALREIRYEQSQTDLKIPRACFKRLVYDILKEECKSRLYEHDVTLKSKAIDALQEASEAYLVKIFQDAQIFAIHGNRNEIACKDIVLAKHFPRKDV